MPISRSYIESLPIPQRTQSRARARNDVDPSQSEAELPSTSRMPAQFDTNNSIDSSPCRPESRAELIERIKREQRPAWLRTVAGNTEESEELIPKQPTIDEGLVDPKDIERPRSALHAGDFSQAQPGHREPLPGSPRPFLERPGDSWPGNLSLPTWDDRIDFPSSSRLESRHVSAPTGPLPVPVFCRNRAASYTSLGSSFIYQSPTSPLAHHASTNDADLLGGTPFDRRNGSSEMSSRRRASSPHSLRHPHLASLSTSELTRTAVRREGTFPYQAHQPRRSVTYMNGLALSGSWQTEAAHRRSSVHSGPSPLQRLPMIGSYEESILRGRMSTLPSKPLEFVAKIGVLGRGKCKPSLRCPPHISVPFPAVFYDYSSQKGPSPTRTEGPSPYVGLIDLAHLEKMNLSTSRHDQHRDPRRARTSAERISRRHADVPSQTYFGAYRIPQRGQLQIVIKNPNNTAVKLFLVPYDLTGMTSGQKTFIRQRSYSAGPLIDMPLSCRANLGTDRPEASLSSSSDPNDRPKLRYLIHIHICCLSNGKFYLYKNIRVVFANRVLDGKEKLRNEIQLPDPRYSPFKLDVAEASNLDLHDSDVAAAAVDAHSFAKRQHSDVLPEPTFFPTYHHRYEEEEHSDASLPLGFDASRSPASRVPWRMRPHPAPLSAFNAGFASHKQHHRESEVGTKLTDEPPSRQVGLIKPEDGSEGEVSNGSEGRGSIGAGFQHVYDKLPHQEYGEASLLRTQSPQPGQGLIALQFKDWAVQRRDGSGPGLSESLRGSSSSSASATGRSRDASSSPS